jgi:hypothetical protein
MHKFLLSPFFAAAFTAALLFAACDFAQLHNPNAGAGGSTETTTGGTPTTSGSGGSATSGAGSSTGGASGATSASTTSSTASGGSAGAGGSTTTTTGAGGMGGSTGGTTADASVGGSGGSTAVDAASENAGCTAGYALQLNGSTANATLMRSVQDDFTLEAWIKPSASLAVLSGANIWNGYGIIYADTSSTANDFGTSIVNGKFAFGVGNPDTNVQSAGSIANDQWTHVAATRNMATGDIEVIINGVMDGMKTTTQKGSLTAPTIITLGADTLDSHFFNGLIDEVRLWNVVRTPADIMATMHQRLTGNEPGLVGYYRFDEGTGTTSQDGSPTHADATLIGGATFVASDAPVCP